MEIERNSHSPIRQQSKKIASTQQIRGSLCVVPMLPLEIITEILLRLPVKSLLKFKCVSKSWNSFISSPDFIKAYLKFSNNDLSFTHHRIMFTDCDSDLNLRKCSLTSLLSEPVTDALTISYPESDGDSCDDIWVVGSCNGLICISIEGKSVFLWNPSLRKYKKLPYVDEVMNFRVCSRYGFGFDETNDDYKVVGIFSSYGQTGRCWVKVYSLKTNSSRRIEDFKAGLPCIESAKFAHGKLHWSVPCESDWISFTADERCTFISLDMESETYGTVDEPKHEDNLFCSILGVLRGCLCLLCDYNDHVEVWVLKEYGVNESWTKLFAISCIDHPTRYAFTMPMCVLPNGEIVLGCESDLVVYNPKENSLRTLNINNFEFVDANIYIESLVLPALCDGEACKTCEDGETYDEVLN